MTINFDDPSLYGSKPSADPFDDPSLYGPQPAAKKAGASSMLSDFLSGTAPVVDKYADPMRGITLDGKAKTPIIETTAQRSKRKAKNVGSVMGGPAESGDIDRTWSELGSDVVDSAVLGANNVAGGALEIANAPQHLINLVNKVPNTLLEMGGSDARIPSLPGYDWVRGTQSEITNKSEIIRAGMSDKSTAQNAEIEATDGLLPTIQYLLSNPSYAMTQGVEQGAQLAGLATPGGVAAKLAGSGVLAGGQMGDQVSHENQLRVERGEITQDEANQLTSEAAIASGMINTLLQKVIPGGQTLERAAVSGLTGKSIAGQTASRGANAILGGFGEAVSGGAEEFGDQIDQNVATGKPTFEGASKAAGLGAVLQGPLGALAGGAANPYAEPAPATGELDPALIAAANADLSAAPAAPVVPAPAAPKAAPKADTPKAPSRTMEEAGSVIDESLSSLTAAAEDGKLDAAGIAALKQERDTLSAARTEALKAKEGGVKPADPVAAREVIEKMPQIESRLSEINAALEKAKLAQGSSTKLARLQDKLGKIDNDADLVTLSEKLSPSQAMAQTEPAAEPAPAKVEPTPAKAEPTPPVAAPAPDIGPATKTETSTKTREQLIEDYRNATDPDEKAATAKRIAELDVARTPSPAAADAEVGGAERTSGTDSKTAPVQEARSERDPESLLKDDGTDDIETARGLVDAVSGSGNASVVNNTDEIPADVRARYDFDGTEEGIYDPKSGKAYVVLGNIKATEGQTRAMRVAWVSAHEVMGHAGIRALKGTKLNATLDRAKNNPVVAAVVAAMESGERTDVAGRATVEEAISELSAAVRTGDYTEIESRYGVRFTEDQRGTVRKLFDNILSAIRAALGSDKFTDADLYKLIENAGKAGDAEASTADPVASRNTRNVFEDTAKARKKLGLDPKGNSPRAIGEALNKSTIAKHGQISDRDTSAETVAALSSALADDVAYQMGGENSGVGWYSEDYPAAVKELAAIYPELATDKQARDVLTTLLAVTSNGERVVRNLAMARQVYENYRDGKDITDNLPDTKRQDVLSQNVALIQDLFNTMGVEGAVRYLQDELTVAEINKAIRAEGGKSSSAYPSTATLPRAALYFGPKLGAFWANLMGSEGYLTMDLWWSRTINRYRGTLLPAPTEGSIKTLQDLLGEPDANVDQLIELALPIWKGFNDRGYKDGTPLEKAANNFIKSAVKELNEAPFRATDRGMQIEVAKAAQKKLSRRGIKLSIADIQAAVWYYEKRLYTALGSRDKGDIGYAEAIRKAAKSGTASDRSDGRAALESGVDPAKRSGRKGREAAGDVSAKPVASKRNPYGKAQGTDLEGLPSRVRIGDRGLVEFHGYAPAQEIAARFAARHGSTLPTTHAKVDVARAERIAEAYDAMEHAPNDPKVKAAFRAMIDETVEQYREIEKTGLKIEFIGDENPYPTSPREAILDVVENNHLWVFPTDTGFGSSAADVSDNPLLEKTGIMIDGRDALANDIFRIVHDYFGHIANGIGFRAEGEENAWREHSAMYSPAARRAMTTETRGQNSWVNYGPNGEFNRTASGDETIYADQKTGLLPEWVTEDGAADAPLASRARPFAAKKQQSDAAPPVVGYHYSTTAGLRSLDPKKAGSGSAGGERRRFGMGTFGANGGTAARVAFYVSEDGSVPKAESAVSGQNLYSVELGNLYDLDDDVREYVEEAGMNRDYLEELISDGGFDGFIAPEQAGIDYRTAVLFDLGNKKVPVEPVDGPRASRRTPADARSDRSQLFGRLAASGYQLGMLTQPNGTARLVPPKRGTDEIRTKLQDKMLPLLRVQQAVSEDGKGVTGVTLDDTMSAYALETLMHGAISEGIKKLEEQFVAPIRDAIRKSAFSLDQFQDYIYALAAPERNAAIAVINQSMPDAGSGITTKLAQNIVVGRAPGVYSNTVLTPEAIALFNSLMPRVRALRDVSLDNAVTAGQITPELAAALKAKYPNYVPMRGKLGEDEHTGGTGKGLSQSKANIKRALGRGDNNIPINVLGELIGDAQRSVAAREKAKVTNAFLRFALEHPMPDMYVVEPVETEWKFSESTGEAYLGVKDRNGDIDTTMIAMHNGEQVHVRILDDALMEAVMNMGPEDFKGFVKWVGKLNRWRSAVLTRYNPAFTPVNVIRDLHFGMTAAPSELGPKAAGRVAILYPQAMRAGWRHVGFQRGDSSVPDSQKSMDDWAAEFYETGGNTGITITENPDDLQKRLTESTMSIMQLAASGKIIGAGRQSLVRAGGPLIDAIERVNEASENAMRISVYVEQRRQGVSRTKAGEYAKNLTINFNRKGQYGSVLNSIFLFYNASVQGTHAVARVMSDPKVIAYLMGLGGLQAFLAAGMMGDDDDDGVTQWDKIPDYVKRTSIVVPTGPDTYFAIPMPYGFNFFTYLGGRGMQSHSLGKRPTDTSMMLDLLKSLTESFSPLPVDDGYSSLFGDQMAFAMRLAANKDDFGRDLAKSNPYAEYDQPMAMSGKATTPRVYHSMAQILGKVGGADYAEKIPPVGYLDVAPEQLEAFTRYFGGGIASLSNKSLSWWEQMDAGNLDSAMKKVVAAPIASRFVGELRDSSAVAERYYGEKGEFARHRDIINERLAQGMTLEEAKADRPAEYVDGMGQAKYKGKGKRDDGTRYKKGDVRVGGDGLPVVQEAKGSATSVKKTTDKAVKSINSAITSIRGEITNAEIASLYQALASATPTPIDEVSGKPKDIGLPEGFTPDVAAPKRVKTRAIKLLQEVRAEHERELLKAVSRVRSGGGERERDDNRISDRETYAENYRKSLASRGLNPKQIQSNLDRNQIHHVLPDNVAQSHPLLVAARSAGYSIDDGDNLIGLPNKSARSPGGDVGHWTSHPRYDAAVVKELDAVTQRLSKDYGSPSNVPRDTLIDAIRRVQRIMRKKIEAREVPIKDGRLAALSDASGSAS